MSLSLLDPLLTLWYFVLITLSLLFPPFFSSVKLRPITYLIPSPHTTLQSSLPFRDLPNPTPNLPPPPHTHTTPSHSITLPQIDDSMIAHLKIPNGIPLVYTMDENLNPILDYTDDLGFQANYLVSARNHGKVGRGLPAVYVLELELEHELELVSCHLRSLVISFTNCKWTTKRLSRFDREKISNIKPVYWRTIYTRTNRWWHTNDACARSYAVYSNTSTRIRTAASPLHVCRAVLYGCRTIPWGWGAAQRQRCRRYASTR